MKYGIVSVKLGGSNVLSELRLMSIVCVTKMSG